MEVRNQDLGSVSVQCYLGFILLIYKIYMLKVYIHTYIYIYSAIHIYLQLFHSLYVYMYVKINMGLY